MRDKLKVVTVFVLTGVLWFSSCTTHTMFYYKYKNVVVTRIDGDAESDFYYGEFKTNDALPKSFLKITYPGIDGGLDGYLIFEDKGVAAVHMSGFFEIIGTDGSISIKNFLDNGKFIQWQDSINKKFQNVVRISDYKAFQDSTNAKNKSTVLIQQVKD